MYQSCLSTKAKVGALPIVPRIQIEENMKQSKFKIPAYGRGLMIITKTFELAVKVRVTPM